MRDIGSLAGAAAWAGSVCSWASISTSWSAIQPTQIWANFARNPVLNLCPRPAAACSTVSSPACSHAFSAKRTPWQGCKSTGWTSLPEWKHWPTIGRYASSMEKQTCWSLCITQNNFTLPSRAGRKLSCFRERTIRSDPRKCSRNALNSLQKHSKDRKYRPPAILNWRKWWWNYHQFLPQNMKQRRNTKWTF